MYLHCYILDDIGLWMWCLMCLYTYIGYTYACIGHISSCGWKTSCSLDVPRLLEGWICHAPSTVSNSSLSHPQRSEERNRGQTLAQFVFGCDQLIARLLWKIPGNKNMRLVGGFKMVQAHVAVYSAIVWLFYLQSYSQLNPVDTSSRYWTTKQPMINSPSWTGYLWTTPR